MRTRRSASQPTRPPRTGPVGPSPSGAARSPSSSAGELEERLGRPRRRTVREPDGEQRPRASCMPSTVADADEPLGDLPLDRQAAHEADADARLDGGLRGLRQPELGHDVEVARAHAEPPQLALRSRPARRTPPAARTSGAARSSSSDTTPPGERVARRHAQHDLVAQERLEQQRPVRPLGADDAELDLPVDDQRDHRVGVVDPQRDVHLGVPLAERGRGSAAGAAPTGRPTRPARAGR